MSVFIQTDTAGTGASGGVFADRAFFDLALIANGDTGIGFTNVPPNLQQITYARTDPGAPATRLDQLVNTNFNVNPQNIDILVLAVAEDFVLGDGSSILTRGGTALPPGFGSLNPTTSCLVLYDTSSNDGQGYCVAREGTGDLDLPMPISALLYHELSHALRIVTTGLLELTGTCDPASPEENAAIVDENVMRDQLGKPHRDPNIHCGTSCGGGGGGGDNCCVVASVASGSPFSAEVAALRQMRDGLLRRSEVGFEFFRDLHEGYYGFSPEVCRMMAREPALRDQVLAFYVRPLVLVLRLLERYTLGGLRGASLAAFFEEDLGRALDVAALGEAELALAASILRSPGEGLGEALAEVLAGSAPGMSGPSMSEVYLELAVLLRDVAVPDEHARWGLIEPLGIYLAALLERRRGADAAALAASLEPVFDEWAGRLPIAGGWVSLSRDELREELGFLSRALLVSDASRRTFGGRLAERFPRERRLLETLAETGYLEGEG